MAAEDSSTECKETQKSHYSLRSLLLEGPPAAAPRMNLSTACLTP